MKRVTPLRSLLARNSDSSDAGKLIRVPLLEPLENRQLLSVSVGSVAGTTLDSPPPATVLPINNVVGVGVTIQAVAGQQFTGVVGMLRGVLPPAQGLLVLQASIDWGDGSRPSAGSFSPSPAASAVPQLLVDGSHTYSAPGTFKVTVTVFEGALPGGTSPVPQVILLVTTINSTAIVSPGPIAVAADAVATVTGTGVTINTEATDLFTGTVGIVKGWVPPVTTTATQLTRLVASIDWGDKTPLSGGLLVKTGTGAWDVNGSHVYAKPGTYPIVVKVYQQTGPIIQPVSGVVTPTPLPSPTAKLLVTIDSTANVTPDTDDTGVTLNEVVNKSFTASLGTFDYPGILPVTGTSTVLPLLEATITWGDGSTSTGKVVAVTGKPGEYSVVGTHTYTKTGKYTAKVVVTSRPVVVAGGVEPPVEMLLTSWDSTINVAAASAT